jgi:hypothetical protein
MHQQHATIFTKKKMTYRRFLCLLLLLLLHLVLGVGRVEVSDAGRRPVSLLGGVPLPGGPRVEHLGVRRDAGAGGGQPGAVVAAAVRVLLRARGRPPPVQVPAPHLQLLPVHFLFLVTATTRKLRFVLAMCNWVDLCNTRLMQKFGAKVLCWLAHN